MIQHPHPKLRRVRVAYDFSDLQHITRNIVPLTGLVDWPSVLINEHFETIKAFGGTTLSNQAIGFYFECVVWDALLQYGVEPHDHNVDMVDGRNAEADILVGRYPLMLKTSLRERWKQIDRDALVMTAADRRLRPWVITYREKPGQNIDQLMDRLEDVEDQCMAKVHLVTIFDSQKFNALLDELRKEST